MNVLRDRAVTHESYAEVLERILGRAKSEEGLIVTGIGARKTPEDILRHMTKIGRALEEIGAILRSGGAAGADLAFEAGFRNPMACEIFHPYNGFKPKIGNKEIDVTRALGRKRPTHGAGSPIVLTGDMYRQAEAIAEATHPRWDKCTKWARQMHTRNIPQIIGATLTRTTDLVICWTEDGRASGGTGQAMRYAERNNVKIINLKLQKDRQAIMEALKID